MSQRLTPIDILNLRFRRSLRGYSVADVDDFVRRVAGDLEAVLTEYAAQKERLGVQERELAQYHAMEATLRDALVLAQKTADETRAAAHARAEASLHEAQARVRDMDAQMQARVTEMTAKLEILRQERRRLARDLRAQLTAHLAWLTEEMEAEPVELPVSPASTADQAAVSAQEERLPRSLDADRPIERPISRGLEDS